MSGIGDLLAALPEPKPLEGQELADQLYDEWKISAETLSRFDEVLLQQIPESWRKAERLDPELALCLYNNPSFMGPILKHPLVFGVPYRASENPRYNYGLHWKRECLEKYAAARDFAQFIHAHERPYRCDAVQTIIDNFDPDRAEVWNAARVAWMDSENTFQNDDEWRNIFDEWWDDGRHHFMTDDDRAEWAMLPDNEPIPVYRGFAVDGREQGMSWTTDKIRAKYFARRFAGNGVRGAARLAIGRVFKIECVGYLNGRNESEVVVYPENVDLIRIGKVPMQ